MPKLMPCPFSAQPDNFHVEVVQEPDMRCYVECSACHCRGPQASSIEEAIILWNNQHVKDQP